MAAPKKSTVILCLVLIGLVVLFVVGVVAGGAGAALISKPSRITVEAWRKRLLSPMTAADIRNEGCAFAPPGFEVPVTMPPGGECRLLISPSSHWLRRLYVTRQDGVVHIEFTSKGDPQTPTRGDLGVKDQNAFELSVSKDGGSLKLSCFASSSGVPCIVVVLAKPK